MVPMSEDKEIQFLKTADAFVETLANGKHKAAAQNLRQLKRLDLLFLHTVADLLDGSALPKLFPWVIEVRRRWPGRPAIHDVHPTKGDIFFNLLSAKKMKEAAAYLRKTGALNFKETQVLANLLDDDKNKLPWRLVLRKRGRGALS